MQFNLPFRETIMAPDCQTVLLLELLQYPQSAREWQLNRAQFGGSTMPVGWAFVDLGHADVHHALQKAQRERCSPAKLQVQVYGCASTTSCALQELHGLLA